MVQVFYSTIRKIEVTMADIIAFQIIEQFRDHVVYGTYSDIDFVDDFKFLLFRPLTQFSKSVKAWKKMLKSNTNYDRYYFWKTLNESCIKYLTIFNFLRVRF